MLIASCWGANDATSIIFPFSDNFVSETRDGEIASVFPQFWFLPSSLLRLTGRRTLYLWVADSDSSLPLRSALQAHEDSFHPGERIESANDLCTPLVEWTILSGAAEATSLMVKGQGTSRQNRHLQKTMQKTCFVCQSNTTCRMLQNLEFFVVTDPPLPPKKRVIHLAITLKISS